MSDEWRPGRCYVCDEEWSTVRHLPFYCNGSEGIYVCQACNNDIATFIRMMSGLTGRGRIRRAMQARDEAMKGVQRE